MAETQLAEDASVSRPPSPRGQRASGPHAPENITRIRKGIIIEGEVKAGENLIIDGKVDGTMPKHRLVAFTGVSGSGKSSLVFDTICTEAQRQLVETFSTYARRRLPQLTRPPVDAIRNISPCIVIDQKRLGASSRSTVGTITEIYTYLRMLFSRCGQPFVGWSSMLRSRSSSLRTRIEKVHHGTTYERTFEGVARKLERLHVDKDEDRIPRSSREAYRRLFTERACPDCGGVRLNAAAREVELAGGWTIGRLVGCELTKLDRVLEELVAQDDYEPIRDVIATLVARMRGTLQHLINIGVGYLSLNRCEPTLSGGESQRVKDGSAARLRPRRSHLHPERADRGTPSAGHRSPHRHAPAPA